MQSKRKSLFGLKDYNQENKWTTIGAIRTQKAASVFALRPHGAGYRDRTGSDFKSVHRAGFSAITSRTVNTPMIPMDLDVARKGG